MDRAGVWPRAVVSRFLFRLWLSLLLTVRAIGLLRWCSLSPSPGIGLRPGDEVKLLCVALLKRAIHVRLCLYHRIARTLAPACLVGISHGYCLRPDQVSPHRRFLAKRSSRIMGVDRITRCLLGHGGYTKSLLARNTVS